MKAYNEIIEPVTDPRNINLQIFFVRVHALNWKIYQPGKEQRLDGFDKTTSTLLASLVFDVSTEKFTGIAYTSGDHNATIVSERIWEKDAKEDLLNYLKNQAVACAK